MVMPFFIDGNMLSGYNILYGEMVRMINLIWTNYLCEGVVV